MADDEQPQQQAKPEKPTKALTDVIAEEWGHQIGSPVAAASIGGIGHHFLGFAASIPAAGFGLGYLAEQHVKKEGNPEIKAEKLLPEAILGIGVGAGVGASLLYAPQIPKVLGLEGVISGAFGSMGNLAVGAATFSLLALVPLIYYPLSHILNGGDFKDIWKDLKENYFKNPLLKIGVNTITSLVAMDAASGYTWTTYLASFVMPYATSLTSLLAPYLAISPAILLGAGAGLGLVGLYMGYRLAFSREKIDLGKLVVSPIKGTSNLIAGTIGYISGVLGALYNVAFGMQDLASATTLGMLGVAPAPAGKKK